MWFAAMTSFEDHLWLLNLLAKLLVNDGPVLGLLAHKPFSEAPPKLIRVQRYHYRFTRPGEEGGQRWQRTMVDEYLWPLSLHDPGFRNVLVQMHWLD